LNLPNRITLSRIVLIPAYCVLMAFGGAAYTAGAGVLFALLSLTDSLDGYLARKYNLVTDLGKFMDPLADKLLVLTSAALFLARGRVGVFSLIILIARELLVQSLRTVAALRSKVLAADSFGKAKTLTQLISLTAMHFESLLPFSWLPNAVTGVYWLSVLLAAASGANYFARNRELFADR